MTKIVGTIEFDGKTLNVYQSLDDPLFRANDIASMIGYSEGNTWKMLEMCEENEKLILPMIIGGQRRNIAFVTETGLYNILNQSRTSVAKKWREEQRISARLINARKDIGLNIADQFNVWNSDLKKY